MQKEVEIVNALGLHARPAAEFVRAVQSFESDVFIIKGDKQFSADSIMEVLTANLDCGTRVTLEATGRDAEKALNCLAELLHTFKTQEENEHSDSSLGGDH